MNFSNFVSSLVSALSVVCHYQITSELVHWLTSFLIVVHTVVQGTRAVLLVWQLGYGLDSPGFESW
jgi:hypothetical protein